MIPTAILLGLVLGVFVRWWAVPIVALFWGGIVAIWVDAGSLVGAVALGAANAVVGVCIALLLKRVARAQQRFHRRLRVVEPPSAAGKKECVLILLPASDAKTSILSGDAFDPTGLSFAPLASTRATVLDALLEVSDAPDAARRLGERPGQVEAIRRNLDLRDAPTAPAGSVYSGVLYDAIGFDDLDAASRRRARSWIVVVSALWGAVRLGDRIPTYRLNMCGRLPNLAHLPDVWRGPLTDVLPAAARRGVLVDCRSAEYATAWRPSGELAERTVIMRILNAERTRGAASHSAKHTRGLVVRQIVIDAIDARKPEDLADALSQQFELDLRKPDRSGQAWQLSVVEPLAR